jgi:hypothetical protein
MIPSNLWLRKAILWRQSRFIREAHHQLEPDRARASKRRWGSYAACEGGGVGGAQEGGEYSVGAS